MSAEEQFSFPKDIAQSNDMYRNIFMVPKYVLCPEHKEKIIWVDLNQTTDDDKRIFCSQCNMPNEVSLLKYEFFELPLYRCSIEFNKGKQFILEQIDQIQNELQLLFNQYKLEISSFITSKLFEPDLEFKLDDLKQLVIQLSNKNVLSNNLISFIPDLSEFDKQKVQNIEQCTMLLQKCTQQMAKIMNLQDPSFKYMLIRKPIIDDKEIEIIKKVNYDQFFQIQIQKEINAMALSQQADYLAIAYNNIQGQHEMEIWQIDKDQQKKKLLKQISNRFAIRILQFFSYFLIYVDSVGDVCFWFRLDLKYDWKFGRFLKSHMQLINCIDFQNQYCYLGLGGDDLQIWRLDNTTDENNTIFTFPFIPNKIVSLKFNYNGTMMITGDERGLILIFIQVKQSWEILEKQENQPFAIKSLDFINKSNNFVSLQSGNNSHSLETQSLSLQMNNIIKYQISQNLKKQFSYFRSYLLCNKLLIHRSNQYQITFSFFQLYSRLLDNQ